MNKTARIKDPLFTIARPETEIHLGNPFAESFDQFIVYNSIAWQTKAIAELQDVMKPRAYKKLKTQFLSHRPAFAFAESPELHQILDDHAKDYVVRQGTGKGKRLVLCGAGPSLKENIDFYASDADEIWGCNSAAIWLYDNHYPVTHAFTVDQTTFQMLEWKSCPDIEYLIATTVHPHLTDMLLAAERRFRFFNNYVGVKKPPVKWPDADGNDRVMEYETWLYNLLFPGTIQTGSGLNAVTRALDVAAYMDFDKITVLGADCCIRTRGKPNRKWQVGSKEHMKWLRKNTIMHADGGSALASEATPMTMQATIDGRFFLTKPDMAISAQWLVRMAKASGGKIELVGDGLPTFLMNRDAAFWARMPTLANSKGERMPIPFG